MISEKSLNTNELIRMSQKAVDEFCRRNNLPVIPVLLAPSGSLPNTSFAGFNIPTKSILLSRGATQFLRRHSPRNRVWWLNNFLAHELTHYKQYFRLRKARKSVSVSEFDEEEAIVAGTHNADDTISKYSPETINPRRTHKLHRVNPTNIYRAFHGADPLRKRVIRVAVPEPGDTLVKIGRLTQLNYIPEGNSKHKGTEFYHVSGDDGEKIMKSNLILATDKSGKNFFLVKDEPIKRPFFSSRGIIG